MEFNTKQELYDYLNEFDFDYIRDTKLSSVYFLVEFGNHIEPIYFTPFEDVWFGFPCELSGSPLEEDEIVDFVKEFYEDNELEYAHEFEKSMYRDGYLYDIFIPQCPPFLPDRIKIVDVFSDSKCLDWLLDKRNKI